MTETSRKCLRLIPEVFVGHLLGRRSQLRYGDTEGMWQESMCPPAACAQTQALDSERNVQEVIAAGHQCYEKLRRGDDIGQGAGVILSPREQLVMSGDIYGCHDGVETRDAAQCPTVPRTAPHRE